MLWSSVLFLGTLTETVTAGEMTKSTVWRKVIGQKSSIRSREFYEAKALGLKPEIMFVIRASEYQSEERIKHENIEYEIIRTYEKGQTIELICTKI